MTEKEAAVRIKKLWRRKPCRHCGKLQYPRWLAAHERKCKTDEEPEQRSKVGGLKERKHEINGKPSKGNTVSPETYFEIQAAYATGKFEEFLRGHAESRRISFESLTRRVAENLLAIAHG